MFAQCATRSVRTLHAFPPGPPTHQPPGPGARSAGGSSVVIIITFIIIIMYFAPTFRPNSRVASAHWTPYPKFGTLLCAHQRGSPLGAHALMHLLKPGEQSFARSVLCPAASVNKPACACWLWCTSSEPIADLLVLSCLPQVLQARPAAGKASSDFPHEAAHLSITML